MNNPLPEDKLSYLIEMYDDYMNCEEYHIHDGTGEHEGDTPLPHDFDDTKLKVAIQQLAGEAVVGELQEVVDCDVPASYEQDGKTWQGLAVPRNLILKRIAALQTTNKEVTE